MAENHRIEYNWVKGVEFATNESPHHATSLAHTSTVNSSPLEISYNEPLSIPGAREVYTAPKDGIMAIEQARSVIIVVAIVMAVMAVMSQPVLAVYGCCANIVLTHAHAPDDAVQFAPKPISKTEVTHEFQGWDPLLHRLLDLTTTWTRWTLLHTDMASQWTREPGNIALVGDAAHALLPYLAQGAALAFEDATVLSVLFEAMKGKSQIPDILTTFEAVRKPRAMEMHRRVCMARDIWSMPDGPQQRERDRQLREHEPYDGYPNVLADPALTWWMFGYDAFEEARMAWRKFERGEFPNTRGTWKC
ncbi:hypothetical protein N8T08_007935 [Aspergillus melleus]|uniref:Uncharacterized protein n=1 Tax=Aspergillus melleus TaxID=138277 RepID=A0ACC3AWW0_9EURO|nr:hypothetical protein N8T08_007935 [Aspergillus melleus]